MNQVKNLFKAYPLIFLFLLNFLSCRPESSEKELLIKIPELKSFTLDGNSGEWNKIPSCRLYADQFGGFPRPEDLKAEMKTAWCREGIIVLMEIFDDQILYDDDNPKNSDKVEIFLAPYRGSEDILQIKIIPALKYKNEIRTEIIDRRKTPELRKIKPLIKAALSEKNGLQTLEVLIHPASIGLNLQPGSEYAMQMNIEDSDDKGDKINRLQWFGDGDGYRSSFAMFPIALSKNTSTSGQGTSRLVITDNKEVKLYVFGAQKGEKIKVFKNSKLIKEFLSATEHEYIPDSIDLTNCGLNQEHDHLSVETEGIFTGYHELLLAPRYYIRAEAKPFDSDIRHFLMLDRKNMPPRNSTLFIGSSSIKIWNSIYEDFPELDIIHRGFGGSTSDDVLLYMNEIVHPYHASRIFIYEGDNDVPKGFGTEKITNNTRKFIEQVHQKNPTAKIYIISPKPSPNRMIYWDSYKKVHDALQDLAEQYPGVEYVDVASPMFDNKGHLRKDIFRDDGIHMNPKGYEIWTRVIREMIVPRGDGSDESVISNQ